MDRSKEPQAGELEPQGWTQDYGALAWDLRDDIQERGPTSGAQSMREKKARQAMRAT